MGSCSQICLNIVGILKLQYFYIYALEILQALIHYQFKTANKCCCKKQCFACFSQYYLAMEQFKHKLRNGIFSRKGKEVENMCNRSRKQEPL